MQLYQEKLSSMKRKFEDVLIDFAPLGLMFEKEKNIATSASHAFVECRTETGAVHSLRIGAA